MFNKYNQQMISIRSEYNGNSACRTHQPPVLGSVPKPGLGLNWDSPGTRIYLSLQSLWPSFWTKAV